MSKISKNIKQLRTERGMTQDDLAEKLHVTRQAISSWENDRTQPDVQMLGKLREIFDVSIEELLYGKKRNTSLELKKPDYTSTLVTVFSVLGGILITGGLVLIFVMLWEDMPEFLQKACTFIPIVLGVAAAYYVYTKKADKKSWCEGGAAVSLLGIATGSVLVFAAFDFWRFMPDSAAYILWTAVSAVIMYLLKSVFAMSCFYIAGIIWTIFCAEGAVYTSFGFAKLSFYVICAVALFVVGIHFMKWLKEKYKWDSSASVASWISAIAFPVAMGFLLVCGSYEVNAVFTFAGGICLAFYIFAHKENLFTSPLKTIGFFGMTVSCLVFGLQLGSVFYEVGERLFYIGVLTLAFIVAAVIMVKGKFTSKIQLSLCVSYFAWLVFDAWKSMLFEMNSGLDVFTMYKREGILETIHTLEFVLRILSLLFFALVIASGVPEKKLLPINIGFIGFTAHTVFWLFVSEANPLFNGLVLIAFGAALLSVNLKITKAKKEQMAIKSENDGQSA